MHGREAASVQLGRTAAANITATSQNTIQVDRSLHMTIDAAYLHTSGLMQLFMENNYPAAEQTNSNSNASGANVVVGNALGQQKEGCHPFLSVWSPYYHPNPLHPPPHASRPPQHHGEQSSQLELSPTRRTSGPSLCSNPNSRLVSSKQPTVSIYTFLVHTGLYTVLCVLYHTVTHLLYSGSIKNNNNNNDDNTLNWFFFWCHEHKSFHKEALIWQSGQ